MGLPAQYADRGGIGEHSEFAATTPNIGPYMEYVWRAPQKKASWFSPNFEIRNGVIPVPTGPGLGLEFDPDYLKKATLIKA